MCTCVCEVAQSCPTLCYPMDCSPPGSAVRGILQARILQWVAMPSSRGSFPTEGSNRGLPLCRRILYGLCRQGSCMCVCVYLYMGICMRTRACSIVSDSAIPWLWPTRLLCPWNFPGKNTGVGCHFLLQRIFLTQVSNSNLLHLLHWQEDSLPPVPAGKPHMWE